MLHRVRLVTKEDKRKTVVANRDSGGRGKKRELQSIQQVLGGMFTF